MRRRVLVMCCTGLLLIPIGATVCLSISPTKGMDVFSRWPPSLRWWFNLVTDLSWGRSLVTSCAIAFLSSALALVAAVPATLYWHLTHSKVAGRLLVMGGVSFCVPPIVLAVGLYRMLLRAGLFDTAVGLSLAHLAFTVPVAILVCTARFRSSSLSLFLVARGLGAGRLRAALRWLLATQRATLLGCFCVCTLVSMAEASVTLYVTDNAVVTMSRRVLSGISRDMDPTGFAAMASWLTVILLLLPLYTRLRNDGGSERGEGLA